MIEHTFLQQSPEWHAHRATARNGSDASVIMGCHPTRTRDEWLRERVTGIAKEHSQFVHDKVFAPGHAIEAAMRPVAESIIGEDLYPLVGSETVDGIVLSASFDGLTMMADTGWECKSLNAQLREWFGNYDRADIENPKNRAANELPLYYRTQMQQQCMVSGCARILFTASDGKGDDRHCWYYPDAELGKAIIAAWKQADIDAAAYVPPAATAPAATGRAPETLPTLFATVKGEVTASNLTEFKEVALTAIRSVNRDLKTDQDFADAEKAVKWCEDVEGRVARAKEQALSQTATIDKLFKAYDDISAEARQTRIDLDKLVKARKASLKTELLTDTQTKWADYLRECNKRIGKDYMPQIQVDFAAAIYGKKNFDSMRSALNDALAGGKIEASAKADLIQTNMATLIELASEHKFLFIDTATIVLKANDDLTALVKTRIADHKASELAKEEATRERIRAEEQAKAESEARAKVLAEQEVERLAIEVQAKAAIARDVANGCGVIVIDSAIAAYRPAALTAQDIADGVVDAEIKHAPNVVSITRTAPAPQVVPATPPSMKLGDLNAMLSPITLTADGLEALGFPVAAMVKGAKLYHASDVTRICGALHDLIDRVQARQAA